MSESPHTNFLSDSPVLHASQDNLKARNFSQPFAATEGYFVLRVLRDSDGVPTTYEMKHIIAWVFDNDERNMRPYPVLLSGVHTNRPSIRDPLDRVEISPSHESVSVSEWWEIVQAANLKDPKKSARF